jgi:hypothetical protein
MSTPLDWIRGALLDLGVLAAGNPVSAGDSGDARLKLNQMLDSWRTENALVPAFTRTTKVLSANVNSYTIGIGGSINVAQPTFIKAAGIICVGTTLEDELLILSTEEWAQLIDKSTASLPSKLYFQKSAGTLGTILLYLKPDAAHTLALYHPTLLSSVAANQLSTTYSLPPGYEEAIQSNLAVKLAPGYERVGTPAYEAIAETARATKGNIKRVNSEPILLEGDPALQVPGSCNIYTGEFN